MAKATLGKHSGWGGLYRGDTSVSPRAASFLFPFPAPSMLEIRVCTGKLLSSYFYVSCVVPYFKLKLNQNKQVLLYIHSLHLLRKFICLKKDGEI